MVLPRVHTDTCRHTEVHAQAHSHTQTYDPPKKTHVKNTYGNTCKHTEAHRYTQADTHTDRGRHIDTPTNKQAQIQRPSMGLKSPQAS